MDRSRAHRSPLTREGKRLPPVPTSPEKFTTAFNNGDAESLAKLYTEDAALLPPHFFRVEGRQDIQDFWQAAFDAGVTGITIEKVESEVRGDTAYETGAFSYTARGEDGLLVPASGKYIVIWKHGADGQWRLHRDIWTQTTPRCF